MADADSFAIARQIMVESQIRPNKVTHPGILAAMGRIPREGFLPLDRRALAYADEDVPLGGGRVLIEPMVLARMLQTAQPQPGERVLVVAAGGGYGAAVLASCGCQVTALEQDASLVAQAREALMTLAPSASVVSGPLDKGWAANAPYDLIVIEGAVPEIPEALAAQLRNGGGRLIAVVRTGRTGTAVLAEATPAGLLAQPIFDCATPLLPSLRRAPAFQFQ